MTLIFNTKFEIAIKTAFNNSFLADASCLASFNSIREMIAEHDLTIVQEITWQTALELYRMIEFYLDASAKPANAIEIRKLRAVIDAQRNTLAATLDIVN